MREIDSAIDAGFIFELLNTPKFIQYIGDRGVRSVEQARDFIENRYRASYREHGYGLYSVETRFSQFEMLGTSEQKRRAVLTANKPIGICGFVRRDSLPGPDLGFAFLPEYERKGYGFESAKAVLEYGRDHLAFTTVFAITSQDNDVSGKLLEKLGFTLERIYTSPDGEDLKLFEKQL